MRVALLVSDLQFFAEKSCHTQPVISFAPRINESVHGLSSGEHDNQTTVYVNYTIFDHIFYPSPDHPLGRN
jgi:hypothetical protein